MATPGTHALGPGDGRLEIHTFREGLAQRVGHDLIIDVGQWRASVEVFVYFNNDWEAFAVRNARRLQEQLT